MNTKLSIWLVPTLLYALFVLWYTDFGGPLTDEEIAFFSEKMLERGVSEEAQVGIRQFMLEDTGRQFLMVNIIDCADNPPDVPGAVPGESAQELMDRHMAYMMPALLKRACHPVVMGNAVHRAMDILV